MNCEIFLYRSGEVCGQEGEKREGYGGAIQSRLVSAGREPGLSGGDRVLSSCQRLVAVRRVRALRGCHGVVRRRAGCHGSR